VLTVAAAVAAALSVGAASTSAPRDNAPGLHPSAFVLSGLLAVLAVGCALATTAHSGSGRGWLAAGSAAAALGAAGWTRMSWPHDGASWTPLVLVPPLVQAAVLFTAVTVLTRAVRPSDAWLRVTIALTGVGLSVLYWFGYLVLAVVGAIVQIGTPFTVLAGSAPVNSADEDALNMLPAAVVGLLIGAVLAAITVAEAKTPDVVVEPLPVPV